MSEKMKKDIVKMGIPSSKISVFYNSILLDDYPINYSSQKIRREFQIQDRDEKIVAMIGRLSAEKGPEIFIEMGYRLLQKYSNVRFLLVGDGPLLSTIQKKVAQLGIQRHVTLTGHRTDMDHVYGAIDILVIPSFSEGLPNVLLEAFANGKPIVSTRVGGIPEIISHGKNGFLVEPGRVDEIVDYVLLLLKDPDLRVQMGNSGRKIIEEKFDFRKRTEILEKFYGSIALGKGSN
jgi:glycosyltransferase involved in cell wall biosynthesis